MQTDDIEPGTDIEQQHLTKTMIRVSAHDTVAQIASHDMLLFH